MLSSGGDNNCFVMILRSRVLKVFLIFGLSFMFTAVYINFFQHPPADMMLRNNMRESNFGPPRTYGGSQNKLSGGSNVGMRFVRERNSDENERDAGRNADDEDENVDEKRSEDNAGVKQAAFWERFLRKNNYVTIGAVYDRCENWREQFGTVVLLPDKEFGGVMARTFVNMTLGHELDGGQFNIEVKYNSKDLYDNYWEICELEEELPAANRTFNCPVAAGKHTRVKDKHIPNYLPKGRYQTKAWASDEDEKVFACAYSDFTI